MISLNFELKFGKLERREKEQTLDELYRVLSNACNVIPGGIVCFFPSYDYEARGQ